MPLFFPKGQLTAVPGTIRLSILRRIRLLNMAGTLNPLLLLIVTIAFITWEVQETGITAAMLGREILIFTLLLSAVFLVIVINLNSLVSNSIIQPINNMLKVIKRVKGDDFTPRVRVISNDEIGILGDTGNTMIRGLADRKRIRDIFGRYATPEIRDHILSGNIPVDGELRTATLLFSDLRGFTAYEELTKTVGCDILISQETVAGLTHAFPLQEEKPQAIKGYSKPVTVYRLL